MKELFKQLNRTKGYEGVEYLIDTCFFVWVFENQKEKDFEKFLKKYKCAITSFNAEELVHIHNHLNGNVKHLIRSFLKKKLLKVMDLPVHPGNPESEHKFIRSILPLLDEKEHDPSDAVLLSAAVKAHANVLTRDKHDIFNTIIQNTVKDFNIKVLNSFPFD